MAIRILNKAIIALSMALTLGLSACSGCSPHTWSSSESTISSISSEESESESSSSSERQKKYKITWVDYDGSILYISRNVPEGEYPVYGGAAPTRADSDGYSYTWTGWTPEVVPATRHCTYMATYDAEPLLFTVSFVDRDGFCQYSVDKIENVPYNSTIHVEHERVTINGVTVEASCSAPDEAYLYDDYVFVGWDYIYDGETITGDMEISARYVQSLHVYDITFLVSGGGKIAMYSPDYEVLDGDLVMCNAKGYGGHVEGGPEGEPVTDRDFYFFSDMHGEVHQHVTAVDIEFEFGTHSFVGWYMNGEILRYGQECYGEMTIEVRFADVLNDYSNLFEYEFDDIRREATIVAVKSEYVNQEFRSIAIPRTYNGYTVTMLKNSALCDFSGLQNLYIHNEFVHFEENDSKPAINHGLAKIIVEEGNRYMHVSEGVLYNNDETQLIMGTQDMWNYYAEHYFGIPGTVNYLWKFCLQRLDIKGVYIPEGITTLSYGCLRGNQLTEIHIPYSVTTIETGSLASNKLESLNIPDNVHTLEGFALEYNNQLETITIGSGLEYIDEYTFIHMSGLKNVEISQYNPFYASYNGLVYNYDLTTLIKMPEGIDASFDALYPSTLKTIGRWSIRDCVFDILRFNEGLETISPQGISSFSNLTKVYLPHSIKTLGSNAFRGVFNLTEVHYDGTKAEWAEIEKANWNEGCSQITTVICLDGDAPAVQYLLFKRPSSWRLFIIKYGYLYLICFFIVKNVLFAFGNNVLLKTKAGFIMTNKLFKKALITLGAALILGVCSGCSTEGGGSTPSDSSGSSISETTYLIKWLNYNNRLLYKEEVPEGQLPVYSGNTPTKPEDDSYTYTWTGWTPEIVPATKNTSYKATFSSEAKTFTVTFIKEYDGVDCEFSQTTIEDVPYGSTVTTDGATIEINDTLVTVQANPTAEEERQFDYTFNRWSVDTGYKITGNTTIYASFNKNSKLFDLRFVATGGGKLQYYNGYDYVQDYEAEFPDSKAYACAPTNGISGDPVTYTYLTLSTRINDVPRYLSIEAIIPSDDFYDFVFEGWYYEDELLRYEFEYYGDVVIEARFKQQAKQFTQYFKFEIDPLKQVAVITGANSGLPESGTVVIPKEYHGYPVTEIRNGALSGLPIGKLFIPNTITYIQEGNRCPTFTAENYVLEEIILEEGNENFRLVDGILYNADMSELLVATIAAQEHFVNGHFDIPESVTYIWGCAFRWIHLKTVKFPSRLTHISYYCFYASGLESLDLPYGIVDIEEGAFYRCSFERAVLPDSVYYFSRYSFAGNENLQYFHMGYRVQNFVKEAFYLSKNVKHFSVSEDNNYLAIYNGSVYSKDFTTLYHYVGNADEDPGQYLEPRTKTISAYSFEGYLFETIHIPEGVERFENMAFEYLPNLKDVYFPSTINYLGGHLFESTSNVENIYFNGTMEQFSHVQTEGYRPWYSGLPKVSGVTCLDGFVPFHS